MKNMLFNIYFKGTLKCSNFKHRQGKIFIHILFKYDFSMHLRKNAFLKKYTFMFYKHHISLKLDQAYPVKVNHFIETRQLLLTCQLLGVEMHLMQTCSNRNI